MKTPDEKRRELLERAISKIRWGERPGDVQHWLEEQPSLSEEEAKRDGSSFYIVTDPNFGHGSGCHGKKAPALTASATVCLLVLLLLQNFLFPFFVLHSLRFSLNRFAFFILLC